MGWVRVFRGNQRGCALRRFSAGSPGRSRPRFPALPCFASRHILASPSCASLRIGSEWWRGEMDGAGCLGRSGVLRARGQGSACGVAGEWAGPRQGSGFGIFRWIESTMLRLAALPCCACGPSLRGSHALCLRHIGTAPFRTPLRFARGGGAGFLRGIGALRARGQGNAYGVAGEWAGPTAGERARARGRGGVRDFPGN